SDLEAAIRDGIRIEARTPIAHAHLDRLGCRLRVNRDLAPRVPRRVDARPARGTRERARLDRADVADGHDLDAHSVLELELARDRLELRGEGARERGGAREPPVAQFALLRAGDARGLRARARPVLGHREGPA